MWMCVGGKENEDEIDKVHVKESTFVYGKVIRIKRRIRSFECKKKKIKNLNVENIRGIERNEAGVIHRVCNVNEPEKFRQK